MVNLHEQVTALDEAVNARVATANLTAATRRIYNARNAINQKNSVELTQAMKTTLEILQNSVSKSEAAVQELGNYSIQNTVYKILMNLKLDISTQSIKTLNREYKIYDSVMRQSKNILSRLKKKDIMDKLVLYICFLNLSVDMCLYNLEKNLYTWFQ